MNYKKLKVDELLEVIAERGLEPQDGMLKSDLIAMLEDYDAAQAGDVQVVEAEVIDNDMIPTSTLEIDMGGIFADLDALTANIDDALTVYGEMLVEDESIIKKMDYKEIKSCEQALSSAINQADTARKQFNTDYDKPKNEVKARFDELVNPVKALHAMYKSVRVGKDNEAKNLRYQGLESTYIDFCESNGFASLPNLVPFDRLLEANPKWLNKSEGAAKSAVEVENVAARIASDWGILTKQRSTLPFFEEAEAEFFRTLDVSKALDLSARRKEEQERINAFKAERDEMQAYRAPGPEPEPVQEQAPEPEPIPEPACDAPAEERKPYVVLIDMTQSEKQQLKSFIAEHNIGIQGERYVAECADRVEAIDIFRGIMEG